MIPCLEISCMCLGAGWAWAPLRVGGCPAPRSPLQMGTAAPQRWCPQHRAVGCHSPQAFQGLITGVCPGNCPQEIVQAKWGLRQRLGGRAGGPSRPPCAGSGGAGGEGGGMFFRLFAPQVPAMLLEILPTQEILARAVQTRVLAENLSAQFLPDTKHQCLRRPVLSGFRAPAEEGASPLPQPCFLIAQPHLRVSLVGVYVPVAVYTPLTPCSSILGSQPWGLASAGGMRHLTRVCGLALLSNFGSIKNIRSILHFPGAR